MKRISFQRSERFQIKMYRFVSQTFYSCWLLTVRQTLGFQYNITIFYVKY